MLFIISPENRNVHAERHAHKDFERMKTIRKYPAFALTAIQFWPRMVAPLETRRTLAAGIAQLRRTFTGIVTSNDNEIMAGAVPAIIPVIPLFLQKFIMTGISKAAMK